MLYYSLHSQINTILYKYCELLVGIKKRVIIYEKENIKILINYLDIIAYYIIRKYIQVKLIGVNFYEFINKLIILFDIQHHKI